MSMATPVVEVAWPNNPGDTNPTWTDVSAYVRSGRTLRGKPDPLSRIETGQCILTLDNRDRRFEPEYVGSPYYPFVIDGRPLRVRQPGGKLATSALTLSGNEITDALRTLGVQGDGRLADSSFGIWEASTNLCANGGFESNTTGWAGWNGAPSFFDRSNDRPVVFGAHIGKVTLTGGGSTGVFYDTGNTLAASLPYTWSIWVYNDGTANLVLRLREVTSGGAIVGDTFGNTIAATVGWHRLTVTRTFGATGVRAQVTVEQVSAVAQTFYLDGGQIEQKAYATPYVHTDGATATRGQAGVAAPASQLNPTQGWAAVRFRAGQPSSATSNTPRLIEWVIDGSNYLIVDYASPNWRLLRQVAGSGPIVSVAQTFNPGDVVTVIAAWDAGHLRLSINGSAFSSIANTTVPAGTPPAGLSIGGLGFFGGQINSDVLWFACGAGTLTSADAATLNGLGNTDPPDPYFFAYPAAWGITAVWKANDGTYVSPASKTIFRGSVTKWPVSWPASGTDGIVQVAAVDGMAAMGSGDLSLAPGTPWPQEVSGTRMGRIFDWVFGVGSARSLGIGQSQVQSRSPSSGTTPLDEARQVEDSEYGVLFIADDGTPVFLDRVTQLLAPYNTEQATFSDIDSAILGDLIYSDAQMDLDGVTVRNEEHVDAPGLAEQVAIDSASQLQRQQKSETVSTLLTTTGDLAAMASYRLSIMSDPTLRFKQLTVDPTTNDALWPVALGFDLRTRVRVKRTPRNPDGTLGATASIACLIEGVQHQWDTKSWKTIWPLSKAGPTDFWVMDKSTLDSTTKLAF